MQLAILQMRLKIFRDSCVEGEIGVPPDYLDWNIKRFHLVKARGVPTNLLEDLRRLNRCVVGRDHSDIGAKAAFVRRCPALPEINRTHEQFQPIVIRSPLGDEHDVVHNCGDCVQAVELEELSHRVWHCGRKCDGKQRHAGHTPPSLRSTATACGSEIAATIGECVETKVWVDSAWMRCTSRGCNGGGT